MLDEPTNGLDPQGTREVRALIRSLADDGTTVFVSSHLLAEVEQLCTHVGVMSVGRLVAQGTLDEFRRRRRGAGCSVRTPDPEAARAVLARLGRRRNAGRCGMPSSRPLVAARWRTAVAPEAIVVGARRRRRAACAASRSSGASLEQRFVELTGEGFDVVQ